MQVKDIKRSVVNEGGFGDDAQRLQPNKNYVVTIIGAGERQDRPTGGKYAANIIVAAKEGNTIPEDADEVFEATIDSRAFQPLLYTEEQKQNAMAQGEWFSVSFTEGMPRMSRKQTMYTPRNWKECTKL